MVINLKRQITLDTETTGINKFGEYGHRIIEIGAVEIINRNITGKFFHVYLNPNRNIDSEAFRIHGINDKFLINKPFFSEIFDKFYNFVKNAELIIHNSRFDISFINYEISLLKKKINKIESFCKIIDSLKIARKIFPNKRNNLNALCDRYKINRKNRILHGALLDAKILAKIFLLMTRKQISINFSNIKKNVNLKINNNNNNNNNKIIYADKDELALHKKKLNLIKKKNNICLWEN